MTASHRIITFLRKYAAVLVSLFCLVALYIFVSIGFRSVLGPVLGGTVGGLAAVVVLYVQGSAIEDQRPQTQNSPDYRLSIIITCLYASSIIVMYRFVSYERPLVHYLVFGAFAGYIAYEIATGARRTRVIPQLLVLTFFTYWSSQLAFPAGAYSPDVYGRSIPAIREGVVNGQVSLEFATYLGYLVYVAETSVLVNIDPGMTYFILATAILTGTLLLLSILDLVLPQISREISLYAALLFGCMSWTLGRGMRPNKLNFFYPLILLIGLTALALFSSTSSSDRKRWLIIGATVSPALIFGHQFSSGAAMVLLGTIGLFIILYHTILAKEYTSRSRGLTVGFIFAYILGIIGNPFHMDPLLSRFSGLFLSLLAAISTNAAESSTATGGPGRYSSFALEFLLANTAGQAILFGLAVFGAALLIRRSDWEYDFIILWMAVLSVLLLLSLVLNARDFQPQRFYALLGLLGLNICAGATLVAIRQISYRNIGPALLSITVCLFAIASLVSPVAGIALSPFNDEIPHYPKYDTKQGIEGEDWTTTYSQNTLSVFAPHSDISIEQTSPTRGELVLDEVESGQVYAYSSLSNESGVVIQDGRSIGGRSFAFVGPPESKLDSNIYTNGQTTIYVRR